MDDKLHAALATAKIAADDAARAIRTNLVIFAGAASGFEFLFADLHLLVHKRNDDFGAALHARIAAHKEAEAARERQRAEAEARAAEQRRLAEEAAAARAAAEAAAKAAAHPPEPAPAPPVNVAGPAHLAPKSAEGLAFDSRGVLVPIAAPVPAPAPARADEPATLRLGAICDRLGFALTSAFVESALKVAPARVEGAAKLYRPSDFDRICVALQQHINRVRESLAEAA